jgi:hypothetical protein
MDRITQIEARLAALEAALPQPKKNASPRPRAGSAGSWPNIWATAYS